MQRAALPLLKRPHLSPSEVGQSSNKRVKPTEPPTECSCESYDLYMLGLVGSYEGGTTPKSNDFQRYDFAKNEWTQVDDLSRYSERSYFAVATFKGKIWILGGCELIGDKLLFHNEVHSLDLDSKKWTTELCMKNERAEFCAVVVGDSLFAIGGVYTYTKRDKKESRLRRGMEKFRAFQWRPCANMLNSRARFASCVVGERIYVAGGYAYQGVGYHDTDRVEYYTVSRNEWTSVTGMLNTRKDFRLVLVNDKIYAVGGDEAGSVIWNKSTVTRDDWSTPVTFIPTKLSSYDVFALNGDIYVVGAGNGNAVFLKLRLADYTWESMNKLPSSPWDSYAIQVALIKNRPCENASRLSAAR